MNESFNLDLTNLFITKLLTLGVELIFPCLIVICFIVGSVKLKKLAITTQQPALRYISHGLLSYALTFIVPILVGPLIYLAAGDSFENYIDLTISAVAFIFALAGTVFIIQATLKFRKIN